ncbi:16916_t:CDS:10 [Funneliformis mosseae]|uniref:16916_t:CDS:1 n=1 Tax=Funneliformis mosseae TaxID=27381 RepID=A0A9N8W1V6_FUNMO|nr:16916_t:CDS:10 [Funneliformis mosseae]
MAILGLQPLPSPSGALFYLGHSYLLGSKPHETLTKWARELKTDIYSLKIGVLNFVILNSDKVIGELIQKRAIYSSRLDSHVYFRTITRGAAIGLSPYNDYYKKAKAISVGILSLQKTESYSPLIDEITKEMLLDMIHTSTSLSHPEPLYPRSYLHHKWVEDFTLIFSSEDRRSEYFPIVKYFPNNKTMQKAKAIRDDIDTIFGKNQAPCTAREVYEQGELEDYQIAHLLASLVFAGMDTVASSITWLLAFLANNPSFQEPAHNELDTLIPKHDRLPTYSDFKNLPYTHALIREGQRVYPPTWLGVHHYNEQDDEYNGYHIPANSLVFINSHAISFNEQRYKNAKEFDPYRFINYEQSMASLANGPAEKRDHFVFGAGRRLCTGVYLAEAELFVILARILYCFKVENASPNGEDGKPIPINLDKPIIGAASGIGEAVVTRLVKEGAKVTVADIQDELGKKLVEELNSGKTETVAIYEHVDVTNWNEYLAAFKKTVQVYGRVDIIVNNAGIFAEGGCLFDDSDEPPNALKMIDINLKGVLNGTKLGIRFLKQNGKDGGVIVNTSSIAGLFNSPLVPIYSASKFGVVGLSISVALTVTVHNIRVNVIAPSAVVEMRKVVDAFIKLFTNPAYNGEIIALYPGGVSAFVEKSIYELPTKLNEGMKQVIKKYGDDFRKSNKQTDEAS